MATDWYCSKCGQVAGLKSGYLVFDSRYAIVTCGHTDETAISNADAAAEIRVRVAAKKAAAKALRRGRKS